MTTTQLVDFMLHRFIGLMTVIYRVIEKWEALVVLFEERPAKANAQTAPATAIEFPLRDDYLNLVQLLSLLDPIALLCKRSQAEKCNQVHETLRLATLRSTTLDTRLPLTD